MWVKLQWFGSIPSNPALLLGQCKWLTPRSAPATPSAVGVWHLCCMGLYAPSFLHIHQPVSLSAGQFIINSCCLVKSGPGCGTHTYIYIHCEDPFAMDGFQRPWTQPLPLNDGHSPESSNTYSVNLLSYHFPLFLSISLLLPCLFSVSRSLFFSRFCSAPSAAMSGTFALSKSSPSGLWGGNMKMKCGHGCPFAMCVCHDCLAEVEM